MWSRGLGFKFNCMGGGVNKQSKGEVNLFNERVNGDTSARRRDGKTFMKRSKLYLTLCVSEYVISKGLNDYE